MSGAGVPTFDQLHIFLTVVETGSFAAAGRKLNRATSVISYGVSNLEAQLGVELFDREATRRPQLTEAGRAVLAEARSVAHGMDGLRAKVKSMLEGLEAEVHLAVDVMIPSARLGALLRAFSEAFPTVSLRLSVEAMGAVMDLVLERRAVLGISGPLVVESDEIERVAVGSVEMVPVAAPDHPLAKLHPLPPGAGRDHVQLVLTDRSTLTEGRDFGVLATHTWRLADLGAKHALLREGIGWGNMPLAMVEPDLESGALVRLAMPDHPGGIITLSAIYRRDAPPGPAASWLLRQFADCGARDKEALDAAEI
jgi:DNA-binding transcriptional LysR family regulator